MCGKRKQTWSDDGRYYVFTERKPEGHRPNTYPIDEQQRTEDQVSGEQCEASREETVGAEHRHRW